MSHIFRALVGAVALFASSSPRAQVAPVIGTGCPQVGPVQWSGSPNLNQAFTMSWSLGSSPTLTHGVLFGYPSGNPIPFAPPFTCVLGPCGLYPAPIGGEFVVVTDPVNAVLTLNIPNLRSFLFSTWSAQGFTFDSSASCFTLSQAITFAIGP